MGIGIVKTLMLEDMGIETTLPIPGGPCLILTSSPPPKNSAITSPRPVEHSTSATWATLAALNGSNNSLNLILSSMLIPIAKPKDIAPLKP